MLRRVTTLEDYLETHISRVNRCAVSSDFANR